MIAPMFAPFAWMKRYSPISPIGIAPSWFQPNWRL